MTPGMAADPGERRWAVLAFARLLAEERVLGRSRTLQEYLELFPEQRDEITKEYLAARAEEAWSPTSETRSVAHYTLQRRLNSGELGITWLAHDTKLDREVAIRFTSLEPGTQIAYESIAGACLDHPALEWVLDAGTHGDFAYTVFRHVPGRTLEEELARTCQRGIPFACTTSSPTDAEVREARARTARWFATAARALGLAHAAGVVHGSVGPRTLLLTDAGDPVVTGFRGRGAGRSASDDLTDLARVLVDVVSGPPALVAVDSEPGRALASLGSRTRGAVSGAEAFATEIERILLEPLEAHARSARSSRLWLLGSVGALLLASVASFASWRIASSQVTAERERSRAVLREVLHALPDRAIARGARLASLASLLDEAAMALEPFRVAPAADPEFGLLVAGIWLRIARLRFDRFAPSLGDDAGSLYALRRGKAILESRKVPSALAGPAVVLKANLLLQEAKLAFQDGILGSARRLLDDALLLVARHEADTASDAGATVALRLLRSEILSSEGEAALAEEDALAALRVLGAQRRPEPLELGLAHRASGLARAARGEYPQAISSHLASLRDLETTNAPMDSDPPLLILRALIANEIGHWERLVGDYGKANEAFAKAAELADRNASANPDNPAATVLSAGMRHALLLTYLLHGQLQAARSEVAAIDRLLDSTTVPASFSRAATQLRLSTLALSSQCADDADRPALVPELRAGLERIADVRRVDPDDPTWLRLHQEVATETAVCLLHSGDDAAVNELERATLQTIRDAAARTAGAFEERSLCGRVLCRIAHRMLALGRYEDAKPRFASATEAFEGVVRDQRASSLDHLGLLDSIHGWFLAAANSQDKELANALSKRFGPAFDQAPHELRGLPRVRRTQAAVLVHDATMLAARGEHAESVTKLRLALARADVPAGPNGDPEPSLFRIGVRMTLAAALRPKEPEACLAELRTAETELEGLLAANPGQVAAQESLVRVLVTRRGVSADAAEVEGCGARLVALLSEMQRTATASPRHLGLLAEELLSTPSVRLRDAARARDLARELMARPAIGPQPALLDLESRALHAQGDAAGALAAAERGLALLGDRGSRSLRESLLATIAAARKDR